MSKDAFKLNTLGKEADRTRERKIETVELKK